MRDLAKSANQHVITRAIDVVDGVSDLAACVEHLALNVDGLFRKHLVDREQHARHVVMNVSEPIGSGDELQMAVREIDAEHSVAGFDVFGEARRSDPTFSCASSVLPPM